MRAMHVAKAAFFLAPLVVHSRSIYYRPPPIPATNIQPPISSVPSPSSIEEAISQSRATINVPCQADDEAFTFFFEVLEPTQNTACGSANVQINGQLLQESTSADAPWFWSGNARSSVIAQSSVNEQNHTVDLSFKSVCLGGALAGPGNSPFPATGSDATEVTFARIESIDGRPSLSEAGFTVSFDQLRQQIIGVLTSPGAAPEPGVTEPSASTVESATEEHNPGESVDDESAKLHYLQNELDALTATVNKQKTLVEELSRSKDAEPTIEISQCPDVKCVARKIVQKAKSCAHFVIIKMTPKEMGSKAVPVDPDCYWNHSRQARMEAAKSGQKLCTQEDPVSAPSDSSGEKKDIPGRPSISSATHSYSRYGNTETQHTLLVPLSVLLSCLCLTCFTIKMHRHCCSPRARVERAARCEERRTRRQYANLARQHKWKTWWYRCTGRNTKPWSNDYEEKRSLVQAQERILEGVAQEDIRRMRIEAGYFDEEAAPVDPPVETLPPYRSRASSGRPPSYTSEPAPSRTATVVGTIATDVTSGFHDVPPSSPISDITPDSSIANLSRRNSSDTLHSEISLV